jgi:M6 family metalloprotease-like protein
MTHMKKSLLSIAFFVCGLLLWKPVQAEAATQVDNLVLMVNFSDDGENTFQTNFSRYQEMYTGPASEPNRSVSRYISTISDGQVTVNTYFPQVVNNVFQPITIQGSASAYPDAAHGEQFVQQVITAAQNTSGLYFPPKLDSMHGGDYIDNLTIIVQVDENNTSGAFGSRKADWGNNQTLLYGWHVGAYNVLPTSMLRLGTAYDQGYALASHEFLHTLGAPDLYRTAGETGNPVGRWWDLMAGPNFTASYPLAYTRRELGWMEIETLKDSGTYTLWPAERTSGTRAYILKTSRSDSEFFVVEYRKKPEKENRQDYDYYIPESGLIVYRVNNAVDYHTNKEGNNYIYVFRKDTTDPAKAQEDAYKATVGGQYRGSLGSSDLNAPYTADTIFYSDGSNSGIVINNVVTKEDGSVSFDVEFPVLSADSYWLPKGESINGLSSPAITGDTTGNSLYLAGVVNENGKNQLKIYSLEASDSIWKVMQAAADVGRGSQVDILSAAGKIYVAYTDASGYLYVLQVSAENVQQIYRSQTAIHPLRMELLYEQDSLWISYAAGNTLELINVRQPDSSLPPLTVSGSNISGTKHFFYDNKWYAVYCDYFAQGTAGNGCIAVLQDGYWQKLYTMDQLGKASYVDACVAGGKLYLAAVNNSNATTAMLTYDGQQWDENILTDIQSRDVVRLVVKDRIPYVFWTSGNEKILQAAYLKDDSWQKLASTIGTDIDGFDIFCGDNTLYAVGATTNGIASVKTMKTVEGIPDPPVTEPEVGNGNVVLALPAGYDSSAKIYIDGVEASSTAWQNDEARRLVAISSIAQLGTTAKTAAAYQYNASGIPTGMYVWRLSYNGSYYTATAVPEFENLFSYHGFSVRYTGNTGLRCTFGIDTAKKSQLISGSGLAGYRITEMGTLIMRPDLHAQYPMVYGSNKLGGGKTYGVINGKFSDKVIRRVNGRDQFANVLTKLPPERYNTSYIFRAYAVMEKDGSSVVIYGPEMSRSMYTVCKQILNRGDFKPGTSGYKFLKNIVDSVEK